MKWRTLFVAALVGLAACGKTEVLPAVSPAPVAACLTLVVREEGARSNLYDRDVQKAVRSSFEEAMVSAGFNVLADPELPHDLLAKLTITPGSRLEAGAQVRAELTLENGGQIVDRFTVTAPQETAGYGGTIADGLVDAIFRSAQLNAFTRGMRNPSSKTHLAAAALRVALAPPTCSSTPPATELPPAPQASAPPPPSRRELTGAPQPKTFAFVVGVDAYKAISPATGARADAEHMASVFQRSLGVPEQNIKLIVGEKADKLAFDMTLEWLKLNVPSGGRVVFYFAGRGAMQRQVSTEFLLPFDTDPNAVARTAISLPGLLEGFSQTRAKEILAIVDAGFSGAGPRSLLTTEKPLQSISDPTLPPRTALFAAVTSAEAAGTSSEGEGHFTRFVIAGLGSGQADFDGDGTVTLAELASWVGPRVSRRAHRDKFAQTPSVHLGPGMGRSSYLVVASGLEPE